jgi:hypothetical protein
VDFEPFAFLDDLVQINESPFQAARQLSAHGALPHRHKTDEGDVLK